MKNTTIDTNWETILQFLPPDWREKSKELGAIKRQRNSSPEELLRVLLIHLADGCSLKEAVVRANIGNISTLSSVALFKRLKTSGEWFRWMSHELLAARNMNISKPVWLQDYNVRSVDATVVSEPGSTGTDWRLHYSLELFRLNCDYFQVTRQNVGESFLNFSVSPHDLLLGDRSYGALKGLLYVKENGGDFLVRLRKNSLSLKWRNNGRFSLLMNCQKVAIGQVGQWIVKAHNDNFPAMKIRLICLRKSEKAAEDAMKKAYREMKKKKRKINEETLELQKYVLLATSIFDRHVTKEMIAELYRLRWQIELAFKRLKSIMGLGHLPKQNQESARAWLHGKMLVAMLVQTIIEEGRFFSPWGYPLGRC